MRSAILDAISDRGLTSVMNATKWRELRDAVANDLPFAPAFQRKDVLEEEPYPKRFDEDVSYCGDWPAGIDQSSQIEWIRVRPRRLIHRGRLIPDGLDDITDDFVSLLHRIGVPFFRESDAIVIYGYTSNPGALTTRAEKGEAGQPGTSP